MHYLPLDYNLSNLYESIEWARSHPSAVQAILHEASRFRSRYFNGHTINVYLHDLFTRYHALQRFKPRLRPGFEPYKLADLRELEELVKLSGGTCRAGNISTL